MRISNWGNNFRQYDTCEHKDTTKKQVYCLQIITFFCKSNARTNVHVRIFKFKMPRKSNCDCGAKDWHRALRKQFKISSFEERVFRSWCAKFCFLQKTRKPFRNNICPMFLFVTLFWNDYVVDFVFNIGPKK